MSDDSDMSPSISLGLHRINRLLSSLSSPHLRVPIVHVAGTNGKGSICAYLDSILRASGFSVGRFTSPHLVEPRDSITLNGQPISANDFRLRSQAVDAADAKDKIGASSFEKLTATAFETFSKAAAAGSLDLAVVEVGMGGLGDATNVCSSENTLASVITPIDLDHQAFLGDTVEEIAKIKAGIVKRRVPVMVAKQGHASVGGVVKDVAAASGSDAFFVDSGATLDPKANTLTCSRLSPDGRTERAVLSVSELPLPGAFQVDNAATAAQTALLLASHPHSQSILPSLKDRITSETIARGIATTRWRGRAEWIEVPRSALGIDASNGQSAVRILVDGAHNPSAAAALYSYLASLPPAPLSIVLALSHPRDPTSLLVPLLGTSSSGAGVSQGPVRLFATSFSPPEGMPWVRPVAPETILTSVADLVEPAGAEADVPEAIKAAVRQGRPGERILVCGSLYLVADAIRWAASTQPSQ